jgi:hypothetical protein
MAGYSHRTLSQKLGYKPGFKYMLVNQPANYLRLVHDLPEGCISSKSGRDVDLIHIFTDSEVELRVMLPELREKIRKNGMIWVSWPKKSSGVETDLSGDIVRRTGLAIDLVDSKVCAVDETWSGLKFVIPKSLR